jgi:hypothetical protein
MFVQPHMDKTHRWMGNIWIVRSDDNGETWTDPVSLCEGLFWNAPMAMAVKDGHMYYAFNVTAWSGPEGGLAVIAGDLSKDLLDPESWRMSNVVLRPDTPEGLTRHLMREKRLEWKSWNVDGWLEPNVVNVNGHLRVLSRFVIDGYANANICGICDLADDGQQLELSFTQFASLPGGQCKFFIKYDPQSRLFWMASNIPTDSQEMIHDWQAIRKDKRFNGGPGNERRILMLSYSTDALNWFQAGCIAMSKKPLQSFMYPSMDIDGHDIILISRSSINGHNQHDADSATFHRISNFRTLALDLFPE